jgi:cell division protein ZapA (FtsZ GTPase activity inhibitor)
MPIELVKIELLGASFTVQTDESREYLETLVAELGRRVDSLRSSTRVQEPLKLAILAAVTTLDELTRLRRREGAGEEIERLTRSLISRLDSSLADARDEGAGDAVDLPRGPIVQ